MHTQNLPKSLCSKVSRPMVASYIIEIAEQCKLYVPIANAIRLKAIDSNFILSILVLGDVTIQIIGCDNIPAVDMIKYKPVKVDAPFHPSLVVTIFSHCAASYSYDTELS